MVEFDVSKLVRAVELTEKKRYLKAKEEKAARIGKKGIAKASKSKAKTTKSINVDKLATGKSILPETEVPLQQLTLF
jgi:hypothetical protein